MTKRPSRPPNPRRLRRLYLEQVAGWAVAWLVGISSLFAIAVTTHGRLANRDLDAVLRLSAIAIYGLTWIDGNGTFHDEDLHREIGLLDPGLDFWIIEPAAAGDAETPKTHLAPNASHFRISTLEAISQRIIDTETELFVDGTDTDGKPYRLHGIPTYDVEDRPWAAILAIADPSPWQADHRRFVRETAFFVSLLFVLGLAVGMVLSRRALRPVLLSIARQERFLAAAAHELRNPIAALRAICEAEHPGASTPSPDGIAEKGPIDGPLDRISVLAVRASHLVDDLLLLARLDAEATRSRHRPIRLDLLAEALLPEEDLVDFEGEEVVIEGDPTLLETAVRNLLENARIHGRIEHSRAASAIRLRVRPGARPGSAEVVVEDRGPGFSGELLGEATQPFRSGPGSPGSGLGLALVSSIAEHHDGRLTLENRSPAGARVILALGPPRSPDAKP